MPTDWTPAGNPVSYLETLAQRQAYMEKLRAGFNDRVETLSRDLYTTKINYDTWQRYMRQEIKAMHTAALIIARGGDPKAITKSDWAACQKAVRDQYAYLRNFALQAQARAYLVETGQGDFFSEKYMATRSKLYGGAVSATFYRAFAHNLLPFVPRDERAETECDGACKCSLEFQQGPTPETIHVFWRMDYAAEHCPTCIRLSGEWNPYVLTLPEGLSASEWVMWLPRMRAGDLALGGADYLA